MPDSQSSESGFESPFATVSTVSKFGHFRSLHDASVDSAGYRQSGFLLRAGTRVNYPAMTLHVPGYRPDGRSFFVVVAGGACPTLFTLIVYNV